VVVRGLLCRHHGGELAIPLYLAYCFFSGDYVVFDCGSIAFSAADNPKFLREN